MKAQELRVNNYVNLYNTIARIIPNDFEKWFGNKWENDAFTPIPLTEEWLLKLGFEKYKDSFNDNRYRMDYYAHDIVFIGDELYGYLDNQKLKNTIYVHQLQNLYFALTDEELKLKL